VSIEAERMTTTHLVERFVYQAERDGVLPRHQQAFFSWEFLLDGATKDELRAYNRFVWHLTHRVLPRRRRLRY
jgi:hypothetical protein